VVLATKVRSEMHAGPLGQGLSRKRVMAACGAASTFNQGMFTKKAEAGNVHSE
jgi:hypothetical protein